MKIKFKTFYITNGRYNDRFLTLLKVGRINIQLLETVHCGSLVGQTLNKNILLTTVIAEGWIYQKVLAIKINFLQKL